MENNITSTINDQEKSKDENMEESIDKNIKENMKENMKNKPTALILSGYGINCEKETAHAFKVAGAEPKIIHINALIKDKSLLEKYDILVFPGGFSYGDHTGAGNAFANKMLNNLGKELADFVDSGKPIIGICNGFQIMTRLGLFSKYENSNDENDSGNNYLGKPTHALLSNDQNRYECRWIKLKAQDSSCPFTEGIGIVDMPIAHGEGRFYCSQEILNELRQRQIVFRYVESDGEEAIGYPANPNGSLFNIAGICNKRGNVLGMMPHPERALQKINHPDNNDNKIDGSVFKIFKNIIEYCNKLNNA